MRLFLHPSLRLPPLRARCDDNLCDDTDGNVLFAKKANLTDEDKTFQQLDSILGLLTLSIDAAINDAYAVTNENKEPKVNVEYEFEGI